MVGAALRRVFRHGAVADYLIEQGADINARSTNGSSVLMMAVTKVIRTWRAS